MSNLDGGLYKPASPQYSPDLERPVIAARPARMPEQDVPPTANYYEGYNDSPDIENVAEQIGANSFEDMPNFDIPESQYSPSHLQDPNNLSISAAINRTGNVRSISNNGEMDEDSFVPYSGSVNFPISM